MVDQPQQPTPTQTTDDQAAERGAKFLDHIVEKYGPGKSASAFKQNRFLLDVANIQEGKEKPPSYGRG